MFFIRFRVSGAGEGVPKGMVYNLLMRVFTLGSSKIQVSDT